MFEVKFSQYSGAYKHDCLSIFDSNTPKYFADWERSEFEDYLDNHAAENHFFVVICEKLAVGCGGYEVRDSVAGLTWGMVSNQFHGRRIGEELLKYRLEHISENYGDITLKIQTSQYTEGFFKKHGFITTDIVENGYDPGLHTIHMQYQVKADNER